MVGTAEAGRRALGLGHDRRGMVAADVEEAAQHVVLPADDDHRFAGAEFARQVPSPVADLLDAAGELPRAREHGAALQVEDARVDVPVGGDGRGVLERRVARVALDDLLQRATLVMRRHG